jgi:hypothetical protein
MPHRQRVVTYGISTFAAATITIAALLQPWRTGDPVPPPPLVQVVSKRAVDVVFAVDTTGSMGGLIDGAKRTVWSIATHIRKTEPNADLRIGLVAYRDVGDDYVTRDFGLTGDLDAVFVELSGFRAEGGGDAPEDVDAALDDVLHKMQWRGEAKKLVFLVGDAPPASRGDVPRFDVLAREAAGKQIILNTIRCGEDAATEAAWQQIASLAHGQFSTIRQDGGVQQIATPYDDKLADLSARIDSAAVIVGDDRERAEYHRKMAVTAAAPAAANADRAAYFAGEGASGELRAKQDLVGGVANGTMAIEATPPEALPADLRGLGKAALKEEIGKRVAKRKADQRALNDLAKQRDEYLTKQGAKAGSTGFDDQVNAAIAAQLK